MRILAILAILAMTMMSLAAVEGSMADLPEDVLEDTNKMIVSQMKILEEAQEDLVKLRERYIRSLQRDLRKYERRDDTKAVTAIEAMIAAQKESLDLMTVGRQVVDSGLPVDPNQPQDIFDTRTIEERKADLAAQREWEASKISGKFTFKIDRSHVKLVDKSELSNVPDYGDIPKLIEFSTVKHLGPILNLEETFKSIYPKSYENGVRPTDFLIFKLTVNGSIVIKQKTGYKEDINLMNL